MTRPSHPLSDFEVVYISDPISRLGVTNANPGKRSNKSKLGGQPAPSANFWHYGDGDKIRRYKTVSSAVINRAITAHNLLADPNNHLDTVSGPVTRMLFGIPADSSRAMIDSIITSIAKNTSIAARTGSFRGMLFDLAVREMLLLGGTGEVAVLRNSGQLIHDQHGYRRGVTAIYALYWLGRDRKAAATVAANIAAYCHMVH